MNARDQWDDLARSLVLERRQPEARVIPAQETNLHELIGVLAAALDDHDRRRRKARR